MITISSILIIARIIQHNIKTNIFLLQLCKYLSFIYDKIMHIFYFYKGAIIKILINQIIRCRKRMLSGNNKFLDELTRFYPFAENIKSLLIDIRIICSILLEKAVREREGEGGGREEKEMSYIYSFNYKLR